MSITTEFKEAFEYDPITIEVIKSYIPLIMVVIIMIPVIYCCIAHGHKFTAPHIEDIAMYIPTPDAAPFGTMSNP